MNKGVEDLRTHTHTHTFESSITKQQSKQGAINNRRPKKVSRTDPILLLHTSQTHSSDLVETPGELQHLSVTQLAAKPSLARALTSGLSVCLIVSVGVVSVKIRPGGVKTNWIRKRARGRNHVL